MEHTCVICGAIKPENLMILGYGICEDCEKDMIRVDMEDTQYDSFIGKLRYALAAEG